MQRHEALLVLPLVNPVERSLSHSVHSALDLAASIDKYVSFGHSRHSRLPLPSWYLPGEHSSQTPGCVWYVPLSQGLHELAPVFEFSPILLVPH